MIVFMLTNRLRWVTVKLNVLKRMIKVACFRCGQHGHLYSDRHCPMFDKPLTDEEKRKRGKQIFTIEGNDIIFSTTLFIGSCLTRLRFLSKQLIFLVS